MDLLLLLPLAAAIALAVMFIARYYGLRSRVAVEVSEQVAAWQQRDLQTARGQIEDAANRAAVARGETIALEQFNEWKTAELRAVQGKYAFDLETAKNHLTDELRAIQGKYAFDLETAKNHCAQLAQQQAMTQFEQWRQEREEAIRRDAIDRSKAVIVGKVSEHLIPYLPDFPFNPKDARFVGSPVDLLVFDGLDAGELQRIVLVEVKTGQSALSKRERQIRDAVRGARVEWQELRIGRQTPFQIDAPQRRSTEVTADDFIERQTPAAA